MAKLAPLLERLSRHDEAATRAGEASAKLVIASGRRGRIEGDGDFETVSSAALSEDEVRDLLAQTGGGTRIDRLDGKSTEWTFRHEGVTYNVDARVDGREMRATIRRTRSGEAPPMPRPVTSAEERDRRAPLREEFAPRRKDPRADEAQTLGQVREERKVTRAKTIDPRADEDVSPARGPAATPASAQAPLGTAREVPKEKRRDSKARRSSKRDLRSQAETPNDPECARPEAGNERTSADEEAWTQAVGGARRAPLFSIEAPDAEVRDLAIEPDDVYSRATLTPEDSAARQRSAEPRVHRAVTVRGPEPKDAREPLPAVFGIELDDVCESPTTPKREPTKAERTRPEPTRPESTRPEPAKAEPTKERPRADASSEPLADRSATREATVEAAPIEVGANAKLTAKPAPAAPPSSPAAVAPLEPKIAFAPRSPLDTAAGLDPALEKLVEQARSGGASDLHIVAGRPAIARICGALVPAGAPLAADAVEAMVLGSIPPHRRALFERDGAASFACVVGKSARCRVAVSRQRTGLKASIRLLPPEPKTMAELELPEALDQALKHHQGLIIISGPSGQGKTTTLAAMVDHINTNTTHHVLTVEDPIEFVHSRKKAMMSQREVGTHTLSFANALRSSLREDPDVIVVGELRDVETVRTALSASETGHLVLGTINTPSAPKTIDRLIDLFPPPEQPQVRATLAAALRLVASQRLLPRRDGAGRVAAVEILPGSLALANLIRDGRTFQIPSLMQRGRATGVVRLDDELLDLVRRGVVDRKDALAAADDPTELQANLEGRGAAGDAKGATRAAAPDGTGPSGPRPPPTSDDSESRGGKALWQRAADMFRRGGT